MPLYHWPAQYAPKLMVLDVSVYNSMSGASIQWASRNRLLPDHDGRSLATTEYQDMHLHPWGHDGGGDNGGAEVNQSSQKGTVCWDHLTCE